MSISTDTLHLEKKIDDDDWDIPTTQEFPDLDKKTNIVASTTITSSQPEYLQLHQDWPEKRLQMQQAIGSKMSAVCVKISQKVNEMILQTTPLVQTLGLGDKLQKWIRDLLWLCAFQLFDMASKRDLSEEKRTIFQICYDLKQHLQHFEIKFSQDLERIDLNSKQELYEESSHLLDSLKHESTSGSYQDFSTIAYNYWREKIDCVIQTKLKDVFSEVPDFGHSRSLFISSLKTSLTSSFVISRMSFYVSDLVVKKMITKVEELFFEEEKINAQLCDLLDFLNQPAPAIDYLTADINAILPQEPVFGEILEVYIKTLDSTLWERIESSSRAGACLAYCFYKVPSQVSPSVHFLDKYVRFKLSQHPIPLTQEAFFDYCADKIDQIISEKPPEKVNEEEFEIISQRSLERSESVQRIDAFSKVYTENMKIVQTIENALYCATVGKFLKKIDECQKRMLSLVVQDYLKQSSIILNYVFYYPVSWTSNLHSFCVKYLENMANTRILPIVFKMSSKTAVLMRHPFHVDFIFKAIDRVLGLVFVKKRD